MNCRARRRPSRGWGPAGRGATMNWLPLRPGVGLDVGQQHPVVRRVRVGSCAGRRGDGAAPTRGEPLPHAGRCADFLRLPDLRPGDAGLSALVLALSLRLLLRLLDVGPATALEAVVPPATHRPLTRSLIGEILARVARRGPAAARGGPVRA